MDIVYKKTSDLVPYFQNPRVISENAINEVAKSFKDHGMQQVIVIDKDNVVVAGHTRLLAAKQLGWEEVPCKIYNDDVDKINAYRLADNKVGELTTWDNTILQMELDALTNMEVAGFSTNDVSYEIFDTDQADIEIEEPEVGYRATDLTNQVPLTFYFEQEHRKEIMNILEKVRDEKDLETKNNALLYIVRKEK